MKNEKEKTAFQSETLTPEEVEFIVRIERFPVTDQGKVGLILVWRGLKPATNLEIFRYTGDYYGEGGKEKLEADIHEMEAMLSKIGLHFVRFGPDVSITDSEEDGDDGSRPDFELFVAKKKEDAEELVRLIRDYDAPERDFKLGQYYGYPTTAARAFQNGVNVMRSGQKDEASTTRWELPPDVRNKDFLAFANFRLSKKNWEQELETAKLWATEAKKIDPILYERMVLDYLDEVRMAKRR